MSVCVSVLPECLIPHIDSGTRMLCLLLNNIFVYRVSVACVCFYEIIK